MKLLFLYYSCDCTRGDEKPPRRNCAVCHGTGRMRAPYPKLEPPLDYTPVEMPTDHDLYPYLPANAVMFHRAAQRVRGARL